MNSKTDIRIQENDETMHVGQPEACDRKIILVVDDQQAIRTSFQRLLTCEIPQSEIHVAENGAVAVEHFRKHRDGTILMDLHMPVMDGLTAFHEIEKICQTDNCEMPSVLFCTGYEPPREFDGIIKDSSRHGLLLKPVSCEILVAEIRKRLVA